MASFPVDCKECHVVDYFVAVDVLLSKNANGDVFLFYNLNTQLFADMHL